jgi:hypothetical protein
MRRRMAFGMAGAMPTRPLGSGQFDQTDPLPVFKGAAWLGIMQPYTRKVSNKSAIGCHSGDQRRRFAPAKSTLSGVRRYGLERRKVQYVLDRFEKGLDADEKRALREGLVEGMAWPSIQGQPFGAVQAVFEHLDGGTADHAAGTALQGCSTLRCRSDPLSPRTVALGSVRINSSRMPF